GLTRPRPRDGGQASGPAPAGDRGHRPHAASAGRRAEDPEVDRLRTVWSIASGPMPSPSRWTARAQVKPPKSPFQLAPETAASPLPGTARNLVRFRRSKSPFFGSPVPAHPEPAPLRHARARRVKQHHLKLFRLTRAGSIEAGWRCLDVVADP